MCEENYLNSNHKEEIIEILCHNDTSKCFAINIEFEKLCRFDMELANSLFTNPENVLNNLNEAAKDIQHNIIDDSDNKSYTFKYRVNCRIHSIRWPQYCRTVIKNEDSDKFLVVTGTVVRMSSAKLLEFQRQYMCVKCKYSVNIKADYSKKNIIKQPKCCTNPEGCNNTHLVTFGELDSDNCKDYQEIKIQENVSNISTSLMPNTMWVTLEDDLVESCKPGDNVSICGIVKQRWTELSKGSKIEIDLALKANHVQVTNTYSTVKITPEIREQFSNFWRACNDSNPLVGRDLILKSFCPELYGMYLVKLAVAIVLAGGSQHETTNSTGIRTRSESHLLLVGDPGTGKSQLLRFASKIISRSVLTTGVGSTSAGLTVSAIMENKEWQLEAGALVLSDGGICCIDEFNSIKQHDRDSIHEAMEQQTISVAKAGIVCKLNSRCSILAACNPKGNLNLMLPLSISVALPSPLLSRFDLILLIKDPVNEDWDNLLADYILNGCNKPLSKFVDRDLWDVKKLQAYFSVIRKSNPKLTRDANEILSAYYQMQRRVENRNKARTTVRLLDSLVRLSQGHARLMYHEKVEIVDSIFAIILIDNAMEYESSVLNLNVGIHDGFPENSLNNYKKLVEIILSKLGLENILEKEVDMLKKYEGSNVQVASRFFNNNEKNENIVKSQEKSNKTILNASLYENLNDNDLVIEESRENSTNNKRNVNESNSQVALRFFKENDKNENIAKSQEKNNITNLNASLYENLNDNDLVLEESSENNANNKRNINENLAEKIKKFKFSKKTIETHLSDMNIISPTTNNENINISNTKNIESNKDITKSNTVTSEKEPIKNSLKDKLSKFKFILKEDPKNTENQASTSKQINENNEKSSTNKINSIYNDIPSVNDLGNIEIDFDCNFDNETSQAISHKKKSKSSGNKRTFIEKYKDIDDIDFGF